MKNSRFILAILLIFTMALSSVATFTVFADGTEDSDTVGELPSSTTLVGTKHLPPISNQGEIGSCASQSITYMQMTNAVSRYLHSIDPDIEWDPSSGNKKYLMSPKFTFDFSGSGTAWVYDILLDHGITTMDKVSFYMQLNNGAYKIFMASGSKLQWQQSVQWAVSEGILEEALEIRLQNWTSQERQIWINKNTYGDSNGDIMLTTSEKGKALLTKIKQSLLDGNVVVTGGLSGAWRYDKITGAGDIGKIGEECLSWSHSDQSGGHQVSIVGYDDNVKCRIGNATLTGAFLVANSWGDWANDGYVWLMYDALNSKSEFDIVNKLHPDRYISMDQFCFTDWRNDIVIGAPELMVQVEVECVNREGTAIYLTRQEVGTTNTEQYIPKMFHYGRINSNTHPDYDISGMNYTFSGKQVKDGTAAETGYFTISFENFLKTMEKGKSFSDYEWGIRVYSVRKEPIVVKSVKLINSNKKVISEIKVAEGGDKYQAPTSTGSLKYWFNNLNVSNVKVNAPEGVNVVFTDDTAKFATIGEDISFKLENASADASVTVNGTAVEAKDGVYTVKATEATNIEVTSKAPVVTPTDTEVAPGTTTAPETTTTGDENSNDNTVVIVVIVAVAVIALGVVAVIVIKKKKA